MHVVVVTQAKKVSPVTELQNLTPVYTHRSCSKVFHIAHYPCIVVAVVSTTLLIMDILNYEVADWPLGVDPVSLASFYLKHGEWGKVHGEFYLMIVGQVIDS